MIPERGEGGGVSEHRFTVGFPYRQGRHQRVEVWANGVFAGRLTMTPEEAVEFKRRVGATQVPVTTLCACCGEIVARDLAEIGADGVKVYHPACWKIVSHEGEGWSTTAS
jgi:hypothetical protein